MPFLGARILIVQYVASYQRQNAETIYRGYYTESSVIRLAIFASQLLFIYFSFEPEMREGIDKNEFDEQSYLAIIRKRGVQKQCVTLFYPVTFDVLYYA